MQLVLSLSPGGTERLVIEICRHLAATRRLGGVLPRRAGRVGRRSSTALDIPVLSLGAHAGISPVARDAACARDQANTASTSSTAITTRPTSTACWRRAEARREARLYRARPAVERGAVAEAPARQSGAVAAGPAASARCRPTSSSTWSPRDFRPGAIEVVYNGIDPGERPRPGQCAAAREALGIAADAFVVGTVGRLDPVKNLAALLRAHAVVDAQHPRRAPGDRGRRTRAGGVGQRSAPRSASPMP